jgi:hypothetical protein
MKYIIYTNILLALFLISCDDITNLKKERRGGFNEELRRNKIRKISEMQFIELAMKKGQEIADTAQKVLGSNLKAQIIKNGTLEALQFCNVKAYSLLSEIAQNYDVEIKRVSKNYRNKADKPNEMELGILDAYQYNIDNKAEIGESIQKTKTGFLYTKPIILSDGVCLSCHGNAEEITPEVAQKINELYPSDFAKNHKLGDLRGMWSIHFTRKTLTQIMYE